MGKSMERLMARQPWMQNADVQAYWREIADRPRYIQPETDSDACPNCGGTGYVRYDNPVGHADFGKMFPCTHPGCATRQEHARQRAGRVAVTARIPAGYEQLTFASWTTLSEQDMMGKRDALGAAAAFCEAAPAGHFFTMTQAASMMDLGWDEKDEARNSIVFSGRNGMGKTSLAVSIAHWMIEHAMAIVYTRMADYLDALKATYGGRGSDEDGSEQEVRDVYRTAPVLIIDELGLAKMTDWRRDTVEQLVNYRYTNKLPTIYTTNLTPERMQSEWGETMTCRVLAMSHWVEMTGVELRNRGKRYQSR